MDFPRVDACVSGLLWSDLSSFCRVERLNVALSTNVLTGVSSPSTRVGSQVQSLSRPPSRGRSLQARSSAHGRGQGFESLRADHRLGVPCRRNACGGEDAVDAHRRFRRHRQPASCQPPLRPPGTTTGALLERNGIIVSSDSTRPLSSSRSGLTMARRSLTHHVGTNRGQAGSAVAAPRCRWNGSLSETLSKTRSSAAACWHQVAQVIAPTSEAGPFRRGAFDDIDLGAVRRRHALN
jgi:hypothetical protein